MKNCTCGNNDCVYPEVRWTPELYGVERREGQTATVNVVGVVAVRKQAACWTHEVSR
jgi:hypothetical protein